MGYDESVLIVSSVDLEWSRPSYTGSRGVSVMSYTVSANGGTVVVSDDSEVVRYTSQSLIYGDVLVSAINSCGQENTRPALINIPASGIEFSGVHKSSLLYLMSSLCPEPPQLVSQTVQMYCNHPLNVVIRWMVSY